MNIKSLLNNKKLLTILHNVLENETTKNKISNVSINGELYEYNRYSLLIIMDFIIKYKIVIDSDIYNNELLNELEKISNTYNKMLAIKDISKKGYSTKGENRGKGLYYVSKILRKYKWLESSQIYLNDFFIQKLCIK